MTLIRKNAAPNPLSGWQVDRAAIRTLGRDLARPECILAERDGSLWAADARGGVMHIRPDGSQRLITQRRITPSVSSHLGAAAGADADASADGDAGAAASASAAAGAGGESARNPFVETLPNGLAFAANGDLLIANFGTDALEVMTRDGDSRVLCDRIDGMPLGKVNFVLRDSRDRLWITVSTRLNPWSRAICNRQADGYITLLDDKGLRVVADGLVFANEVRLDAGEEWLYVAETCARRVTRFRVGGDGSLHGREVYGPSSLGSGAIDGIAFDAYGNLWATMIFADRLVAITPDGDLLTLLDDGNPDAVARFDAELDSGSPVSPEVMSLSTGTIAPWLTSVTFGGPDLRTVYLGSVKGTTIPYFTSPVAGLPMIHWRE